MTAVVPPHALLVERLRLAARTAIDRGQSVLSELLTDAARVIEQQDREAALKKEVA